MVVGVILAGGKSTRFRGNKLLASVDGELVLKRVYDRLRPIVDKVYISVKSADQESIYREHLKKQGVDVDSIGFVYDYPGGEGPLNAILTALDTIDGDEFVITPGDLPWIESSALLRLIAYGRENGATVAVPVWGNGWSECLVVYFNKDMCRGFLKILRWLRREGRATDLQRTVSKLTLIPISMLTSNPYSFVHITTKEDLVNPKLKNSLEGPVKEVINIDRRLWSRSPFIRAMESASDGDYITAIKYLIEEVNTYISYHLIQLVHHTLIDALKLSSAAV